ncbi:MAG: ABC transporter permease [Yaniella sp.]|nr:ABC transporter permease [Yaniella sp.]MDN5704861.1 ABC transporter permease [Yaniella sp.]MDN5732311.1 ABC transporter permease [Yaniella sp.]MDN5742390.1 ABC transporter permease [Yaniella sp.]MDN5814559.1 ABC transporter permease [Yaniella sp.]MDN5816814.1 ABC transporter permease [Yaniella sp.]
MTTKRVAAQSRRRPNLAAGIPGVAVAMALVAAAFFGIPFIALLVDITWSELPELLTSRSALDALWLSLRTAVAATLICIALGIPLALVLARTEFPGRTLTRSIVLVPLVIPPVVAGIILTEAFGRRGLLGEQLSAFGLDISFTTAAVVMAQTFVSLPFMVTSLESHLGSSGQHYERTAQSLGASKWRTFTTITLPLLRPGLISGTVLTFARALGEFGATITFAGSLQGTTRTMPLEIYLARETDPDAAVALSLVLILVAVAVIAVAYFRPATNQS